MYCKDPLAYAAAATYGLEDVAEALKVSDIIFRYDKLLTIAIGVLTKHSWSFEGR